MKAASEAYLMQSGAEGTRLERKTRPDAVRRQLDLAGLRPGMRALDVGCGSGAITRRMARIAGAGLVTGIDMDDGRVSLARRLAAEASLDVEFYQSDAYDLAAADCQYDLVWSRFLFEYLGDPQRALREIVRVTRAFGTVAIADLDGQLDSFYPMTERITKIMQALKTALDESGFDRHVGRKLFSMMRTSGVSDLQVHVLPHQVYAGVMPGRDMENWRTKLDVALPRLAENGQLKALGTVEELTEELLAFLKQGDLFYYSTLILVLGRKSAEATNPAGIPLVPAEDGGSQ